MDDEIPPRDDEDGGGVPVGTLDPDIIGDAGPLDVPPGSDPPDVDDDIGGGADNDATG